MAEDFSSAVAFYLIANFIFISFAECRSLALMMTIFAL